VKLIFNDVLRRELSRALNVEIEEEKIDAKKEIEKLVKAYEQQQSEEIKSAH
jgi:hypothetical protein